MPRRTRDSAVFFGRDSVLPPRHFPTVADYSPTRRHRVSAKAGASQLRGVPSSPMGTGALTTTRYRRARAAGSRRSVRRGRRSARACLRRSGIAAPAGVRGAPSARTGTSRSHRSMGTGHSPSGAPASMPSTASAVSTSPGVRPWEANAAAMRRRSSAPSVSVNRSPCRASGRTARTAAAISWTARLMVSGFELMSSGASAFSSSRGASAAAASTRHCPA